LLANKSLQSPNVPEKYSRKLSNFFGEELSSSPLEESGSFLFNSTPNRINQDFYSSSPNSPIFSSPKIYSSSPQKKFDYSPKNKLFSSNSSTVKRTKSRSSPKIFSMTFKSKDNRVSLSSDLFGFNLNDPQNSNKKYLKEIQNNESLKSSFEDYLSHSNSLPFFQFWEDSCALIETDFVNDQLDLEILYKNSKNINDKYISKNIVILFYFFIYF
jgi:hypothetical protein